MLIPERKIDSLDLRRPAYNGDKISGSSCWYVIPFCITLPIDIENGLMEPRLAGQTKWKYRDEDLRIMTRT